MTATVDTSAAVDIADLVRDAVLADPAVVRLDGGPFGTVATLLPGRRVVGVTVGERVELSVVLAVGQPIPAVARELRRRVRAVTGDVPVDIHVADLATDDDTTGDPTSTP